MTIKFEPTAADRTAIDRLIEIGSAKDDTSAIRLALEVAPLGLEQHLRQQLQKLGGADPADGRDGPRAVSVDVEAVRDLFGAVVGTPVEFGGPQFPWHGFSDGNAGVQWNIWVEPKTRTAHVGVVLVGLKYENYPVARLIENELRSPMLFAARSDVRSPQDVLVRWDREAWQGGGRLHGFPEHDISGDVRLDRVTEDRWANWLGAARACLWDENGRWHRAKQIVTLKGGTKVTRPVSPSIQLSAVLWDRLPLSPSERRARMEDLVVVLRPLYDFMVRAASGR